MQWTELYDLLGTGSVRVTLALLLLWVFVGINIRGLKAYSKTLIPLMIFMFLLGGLVILIGFTNNQTDFKETVGFTETAELTSLHWTTFLSASAVLFASFIGFDSIAQAGSEAKNPSRNLPAAIAITIISVGTFYMLFTNAVYHTVPWQYVMERASISDITAPGLLSPILSTPLAALIILGAAVALINDLPAMLLSVSRLMFAWSYDGIFPKSLSKVHTSFHTPYLALITSGVVASLGILGSHFAGDFFLGVDIMVTSMLVNFLLMCLTLLMIYRKNPALASRISLLKSNPLRNLTCWAGLLLLGIFLVVHIFKDLNAPTIWYFKSTPIWLVVMLVGSGIYFKAIKKLKNSGKDLKKLFSDVPQNQQNTKNK